MTDTPSSEEPALPPATDPWGNPLPPDQQPARPPQAWWPPDPSKAPPAGQTPYGQPPYGHLPSGQPPYGQVPYGYAHPGQARTEGTAVGALVCAIVGLLLCGIILEPVAIVLGFTARRKIRSSGGALKGEGIALAAIVVGIVGIILAIIGMIIVVRNPDIIDNIFSTTTTTPR